MSVWISWPILTVALIIFIVLIIAGIFIVAPESYPSSLSAHPNCLERLCGQAFLGLGQNQVPVSLRDRRADLQAGSRAQKLLLSFSFSLETLSEGPPGVYASYPSSHIPYHILDWGPGILGWEWELELNLK